MCGIAGLIDPLTLPTPALLKEMAGTMACRGPDDQGILARGPAGLAHCRLSIIDLVGGHQPIFNEDKSLAIVCNGEIFDFTDLRRELESNGHVFSTRSDSEVILHLYEDMGEFCLDRLNGMFAFAIADFAKNTFFLARDRFGQKPLFYAAEGPRFAFASGPAALRRLPWVDTTIDRTAIHDFLEYQYIPRPRSIFCGIRKLPPGHSLTWTCPETDSKPGAAAPVHKHDSTPVPYWRPDLIPGFTGNLRAAAETTRDLLDKAVARRLVADVPLGAFLSGGMDSSIICALAQQSRRDNGFSSLKTFSIGFPVAGYDERAHAQSVADHLGTDHTFSEVNPADFSFLEQIVPAFEEPFGDSSMLPTWLLSRFTREHVTVALSGDGADELFGGYYRFRVMHLCRLLTVLPRSLRSAVRRTLLVLLPRPMHERTAAGKLRRLVDIMDVDGLQRYLRLISRFPLDLRQSLYTDTMHDAIGKHNGLAFLQEHWPEQGREVDRIMELDCRTYLPEDILVKVDRASMAHALEVRSPFLDHPLAEHALALPYAFKQASLQRKRVLQEAFDQCLPESIFKRPKMGFGLPVATWLRDDWQAPVKQVLLSGALNDFFRADKLETLLKQHRNNQADHSYALFALAVLGLWMDKNTRNTQL